MRWDLREMDGNSEISSRGICGTVFQARVPQQRTTEKEHHHRNTFHDREHQK